MLHEQQTTSAKSVHDKRYLKNYITEIRLSETVQWLQMMLHKSPSQHKAATAGLKPQHAATSHASLPSSRS